MTSLWCQIVSFFQGCLRAVDNAGGVREVLPKALRSLPCAPPLCRSSRRELPHPKHDPLKDIQLHSHCHLIRFLYPKTDCEEPLRILHMISEVKTVDS